MTADLGATLLPIARAAIAQALGRTLLARDDARWLQKPGATFVTLTRDGQLRPGIDGLVFECHGRRSTFLPQVWEQLPTPAAFIGQLKHKAGFSTDFWAGAVRLHRYTVAKWEEPEGPLGDPKNRGGTRP